MKQLSNSRPTLFWLLKIVLISIILIWAYSARAEVDSNNSLNHAVYLPAMQYNALPAHVTTRRKRSARPSETILVQFAKGEDSSQFLATYSEHIIDQNPSLNIVVLGGTAGLTADVVQAHPAVQFAQPDRDIEGNPRKPTSFGNEDVEAEAQNWIGGLGDGLTRLSNEGLQYTSPVRLVQAQGYAAWIGSHGYAAWIGSHGYAAWIGSHGGEVNDVEGTLIDLTQDDVRTQMGAGVTVAVIDTGIDLEHELFDGRLVAGYDVLAEDADPSEEGQSEDSDGDGAHNEAAGHGTHVAGIVVQVAPGAKIMPVRILDPDGRGSYADLIKGIVWATDHGADIINLSVSGEDEMSFLRSALDYAAERDVTVIASGGTPEVGYPAAWEDVIGVAAVDQNNLPMDFSNYVSNGHLIDLYAPGELIYSSYYQPDSDDKYASWTGNSMATPFVTGVAALIKSANPDCTSECIQASLRNSGRPTVAFSDYKYKQIDVLDAFANGTGSRFTGLELSARAVPNENSNAIEPSLLLTNTGRSIPLNQIRIRYWYSAEVDTQEIECTVAIGGCDHLTTTIGDDWLELGWQDDVDQMLWGGEVGGEIGVTVNYADFRPWNHEDDYSNITSTQYAPTERITVYVNGSLAWGEEPESALSVSSINQIDAPSDSMIRPSLRLNNHTDAPIALDDVTLRYYLGGTDAADLVIQCDYADMGCANVNATIIENALTISFTEGILDANGASDLNLRLHYTNFAPVDETADYSYNGQRSAYLPHHSVTVTYQNRLVWGIAP